MLLIIVGHYGYYARLLALKRFIVYFKVNHVKRIPTTATAIATISVLSN